MIFFGEHSGPISNRLLSVLNDKLNSADTDMFAIIDKNILIESEMSGRRIIKGENLKKVLGQDKLIGRRIFKESEEFCLKNDII